MANRNARSLVGENFGSWTVLSRAGSQNRNSLWLCECICGNTALVTRPNLLSGSSSQCHPCGNKQLVLTELTESHWYRIGATARKRNNDVSITRLEAWELYQRQEGRCALSGISITLPISSHDLNYGGYSASLDRIDSKKSYTVDNVQWVHKDVNWMKNKFDQDYFIEMCGRIADHQKEKRDGKSSDIGYSFLAQEHHQVLQPTIQ